MGVERAGGWDLGGTRARRAPAKDSLDVLMHKALCSSFGSAVPSPAVWGRIQRDVLRSRRNAARGNHATV